MEVSQLAAALRDADPGKRCQAAEELAHLGPEAAQEVTIPLLHAAGDETDAVREWVTAALEEMGPPLPRDVAELASLVSHHAPDVGYWAATLLGRLKAQASSAVPALAAALGSPFDVAVRQRAAWSLGEIGPPAAAALEALGQAQSERDPRLSRLAGQAVARITGKAGQTEGDKP
jgi:HEAT repeat protein